MRFASHLCCTLPLHMLRNRNLANVTLQIQALHNMNLVRCFNCPEGYAATNVSAKLAQRGHGTKQA